MKYILLFGLLLLCCLAEIPDPPRPKGHPKRKKAGKQTVPMPEHFKERREAAERMRKQRIEARKAAQGTGQLEVGHPVPEGFREVRVGPEGSMFRSVARCMHIFETPTNHSEFKNWFDASAEAVAGRKPGESGVLWTKQLVFKMLLEAYTSGRYDDEISAAAAKMDLDSEAYIKHLSKEKKGGDLELSTLSKELKVDILLYRDTDEPGQEPQMFAAGHSSGGRKIRLLHRTQASPETYNFVVPLDFSLHRQRLSARQRGKGNSTSADRKFPKEFKLGKPRKQRQQKVRKRPNPGRQPRRATPAGASKTELRKL